MYPSLLIKKGTRKNKHKVKWHDALEPSHEDVSSFQDAISDEADPLVSDFGPKITADDLEQSHPERRRGKKRSCIKEHLFTASSCLSLSNAHTMHIIDSGQNLHNLGESTLCTHDPFRSD